MSDANKKEPPVSSQRQQASNIPKLEIIDEQNHENEGTADAEKKKQIDDAVSKLQVPGSSNRLDTDIKKLAPPSEYLLSPGGRVSAPRLVSQQTIVSKDAGPVRQETDQTLVTLLTSQNNMALRTYASKITVSETSANKQIYHQKLTSMCLQNKLQQTQSKPDSLGQTYEISEDIHLS